MARATVPMEPSGGASFSIGDYRDFRRAAHLRYVGMPGGDQAIREPWRMAVAHLLDAGNSSGEFVSRLPKAAFRTIEQMLEKGFRTPMTSSAGRLFDAVAVLAGLRHRVSYEGQVAIELEWLATGVADSGTYPFELNEVPEGKPPEANTGRRHASADSRGRARYLSRRSKGDHQSAISDHDG